MVFSSIEFILIFMPIFFGIYYLVPEVYKNIILLIGSLVFYFLGTINNPNHYIIFILSIIVDFIIAIYMEKYPRQKRVLLISGLIFHIVALSYFKYFSFLINELSLYFKVPSINIILPIGISFYTFQGISYLVDVYKGKVKAEQSLLNFAIYISMFAQLIAGPIVKYSDIKEDLRKRNITKSKVVKGIEIFIFGLGLKVLLANPLGNLWSKTCAIGFDSITTKLAWISIIGFSMQIYFDFFGYSLMAIGLGKMLGFSLPKNFNHPYMSISMSDFWHNWHITLGSWFKEYIYIPLGGNKKGLSKTIRNLLIVWLLTGIWHGAGYNFILWGLFLFIVIAFEKLILKDFFNKHRLLGHIYMMILIPISWSIFAIEDIQLLGVFISRLFPIFSTISVPFATDYIKYLQEFYPFLIVGAIFIFKRPYQILKKINNKKIIAIFLILVLICSIYLMYKGMDNPFLYFRF